MIYHNLNLKIILLLLVLLLEKIKLFKNKLTNIKNFFRVMPNLPASIGESMNCIVASKNVVNIKRNQIINLFSYSGKTLILEDENQIDMATAISGSGPGFVFNLIDALENAAISLGFKKQIAKILVSQTFKILIC